MTVGGYRRKPKANNPHDFYPTPSTVTRAFLNAAGHRLPDGVWCEPCVGDGAIIDACADYHYHRSGISPTWVTFDIREVATHELSDHHETLDFLTLDLPPDSFDVIITNPPFFIAEEIIRKALSCATHVAMLLPLAFTESRRREAFHAEFPCDKYEMSRRASFQANGATNKYATAWFYWGPEHRQPGAIRQWFPLVTPQTRKPKRNAA